MNALHDSMLELIRRTSAEIPDDVHRAIVHSNPEAITTRSAFSASASLRPDNSTSLRTPASLASSVSLRMASTEPGTARSG